MGQQDYLAPIWSLTSSEKLLITLQCETGNFLAIRKGTLEKKRVLHYFSQETCQKEMPSLKCLSLLNEKNKNSENWNEN